MRSLSLLLLRLFAFLPLAAWGWSEPHLSITRAALRVLPAADQTLLGMELRPLGDQYCLIPDHVFSDPSNAKFAMMESHPGERYLAILHLPGSQAEIDEALRFFIGKAVQALREGRIQDAARFIGTLSHLIEDYGSPSHVVPGDNMFTLLQQFLPPPPSFQNRLLHSPIESGELEVAIAGYRPKLLGTSVPEVAWRLRHRIHDGIVQARSTTIPIIQALYSDDRKTVIRYQTHAAEVGASIVADAIHSVLALGSQHFEAEEESSVKEVTIGRFFPLEAPNLHYPQKLFSGSPYWGPPTHGFVLREGSHEEPLRLRTGKGGEEETHNDGIAANGRTLSYALPEGVFSKFRVFAGLQFGLGNLGAAEFTIRGDGRVLASAMLEGQQPAREIACEICGVRELQLVITGKGSHPKSNYAVWASPTLVK